jgi:hypothetical protein
MKSKGDLSAEIEEIQAQLEERHDCLQHLSMRLRMFADGNPHHVNQCSICGQQRGGPLAKKKAVELLGGSAAPAFDEALEPSYHGARTALFDRLQKLQTELIQRTDPDHAEAIAFRAEQYAEAHAQTEAAKAAALEMLDAALRHLQVIAPQYRLRVVMDHLVRDRARHFERTDEKPVLRFDSEPELKTWLEPRLARDFEIHPEVPGRHLVEAVRVKIDYVLVPRKHLVDAGFKPAPLGLEVKHLPLDHGGFSPKASRFIQQAISYTDCEFDLAGEPLRFKHVLVFSNLSFRAERSLLRGIDPSPLANDQAKWNALLELANHANVGVLDMYGDREAWQGWKVSFATGTYFRRRGDLCEISDRNLFEKIRIGNF